MKVKQLLIVALTFALGVGLAGNALADFLSLETEANTASADLSGTQSYDWAAEIRNRSDNAIAGTVSWTNALTGVTAGSDTWKTADQYILLHTTITYVNWGIQIYTDNKAADASPKYNGTASDGFNLVGVSNAETKLNMCWKASDNTINPGQPIHRADYSGFTDYCWKWMKDKSNTGDNAFTDDEFYVRVVADDGMYWHENPGQGGNPGSFTSPVAIYIGAWLRGSLAQEYKTNKLILELYSL